MQSSKSSHKASGINHTAATKTAAVKKAPTTKKPDIKAVKAAAPATKKPDVKAVKAAAPAAVIKAPAAKKPAVKRKHVIFKVRTKPGSKVYLAGDFNDWNHLEKELSDHDGNGFYQVAVALEYGTYEYKFHINDAWCVDPENPNFRPNAMGTLNSVIIVE